MTRPSIYHIERPVGATDDECWIYPGAPRSDGYCTKWGQAVHRLSFKMHNPDINIDNLFVLHKCDVPRCFNPNHLFAGTHKDNMKDKVTKLRGYGQKNTHCKQGHEFNEENTYRTVGSYRRHCRKCNAASQARRKARAIALASPPRKGEA